MAKEMGIPDSRYQEVVETYGTCHYCYTTGEHLEKNCPHWDRTIAQREEARIAAGYALDDDWAEVLAYSGIRPRDAVNCGSYLRRFGILPEDPSPPEEHSRGYNSEGRDSVEGGSSGSYGHNGFSRRGRRQTGNANGHRGDRRQRSRRGARLRGFNDLPCENCWDTLEHSADNCDQPQLNIVERERLRQQKGMPTNPVWSDKLRSVGLRREDVWDLDRTGEYVGTMYTGPPKPRGFRRYEYTQNIVQTGINVQGSFRIPSPKRPEDRDHNLAGNRGEEADQDESSDGWVRPHLVEQSKNSMHSARNGTRPANNMRNATRPANSTQSFVRGPALTTLPVHRSSATGRPAQTSNRKSRNAQATMTTDRVTESYGAATYNKSSKAARKDSNESPSKHVPIVVIDDTPPKDTKARSSLITRSNRNGSNASQRMNDKAQLTTDKDADNHGAATYNKSNKTARKDSNESPSKAIPIVVIDDTPPKVTKARNSLITPSNRNGSNASQRMNDESKQSTQSKYDGVVEVAAASKLTSPGRPRLVHITTNKAVSEVVVSDDPGVVSDSASDPIIIADDEVDGQQRVIMGPSVDNIDLADLYGAETKENGFETIHDASDDEAYKGEYNSHAADSLSHGADDGGDSYSAEDLFRDFQARGGVRTLSGDDDAKSVRSEDLHFVLSAEAASALSSPQKSEKLAAASISNSNGSNDVSGISRRSSPNPKYSPAASVEEKIIDGGFNGLLPQESNIHADLLDDYSGDGCSMLSEGRGSSTPGASDGTSAPTEAVEYLSAAQTLNPTWDFMTPLVPTIVHTNQPSTARLEQAIINLGDLNPAKPVDKVEDYQGKSINELMVLLDIGQRPEEENVTVDTIQSLQVQIAHGLEFLQELYAAGHPKEVIMAQDEYLDELFGRMGRLVVANGD